MKTRPIITILSGLVILPVAAHAQEISYSYLDAAYMNNGMDVSASESLADTIYIDTVMTADIAADIGIDVDDGNGFGLRGSWGFHPNWHVFAAYADTDTDLRLSGSGTITEMDETPMDFGLTASSGGDATDWRVGFGYNHDFSPRLSGFAQLSWDSRDVDFDSVTVVIDDESDLLQPSDLIADIDGISIDNAGIGANVGLRGKVNDWLELNGHVRYSEVGGIDLMADGDDILDSDTLFGFGAEVQFTDNFAICGEVETGEDSTGWAILTRFYFGS